MKQKNASTPDEYIASLYGDRKRAISKLRKAILENLPANFEEKINYGMIGYVVPHSFYHKGYHVDPGQPLPFMNIASQKNFIALYHMGLYTNKELLEWFTMEYSKHSKTRLDMGKSCIRFKKIDQIPYKLIGELASKMTASDWIEQYERHIIK